MGVTHFSGPVFETRRENSSAPLNFDEERVRRTRVFIPSTECGYITTAANWVLTRIAVGQYAHVHSGVDETSRIVVGLHNAGVISDSTMDIADARFNETQRGTYLNYVEPVWINPATGGSALDAAPTLTVQTLASADGQSLGAAVNQPVTGTAVATAADGVIRRPQFTVSAPFPIAVNGMVSVELTIDNSATSDLQFFGFFIGLSQLL